MIKMKKLKAQLLAYLNKPGTQAVIALIVAFYLCSLLDH